jgi:hypothetical protein
MDGWLYGCMMYDELINGWMDGWMMAIWMYD